MEERLSVQIIKYLSNFSGFTAYSLVLGALLACGLGVPLPEDVTLIAAGVLAGVGNISLTGAMFAGFFGVLAGDTILFFLGRKLGRRVFSLPLFRTVFTESRIKLAEAKVQNNSRFICFTARFLPGLRAPIYITAGIMGVRPAVFFGFDAFAAGISVPVWVLGGYWIGENIDRVEKFIRNSQVGILAGVLVLVTGYWLFHRWRESRGVQKRANHSPQL